jgi:hypothetical protein
MGFLDPKENVMSIILTQYGRKKLAEGNLRVKYFAFSDDDINYQTPFSVYLSGVALLLDLTTGGTFLRSTSASYYTNSNVQSGSAPVLFQGASIGWVGPDVRRVENSLLLLEGSRTNELPASIDAPGAYWTYGGSGSGTAGATAPDSTLRARWVPQQSSDYPVYQNLSGVVNQSASSSFSVFYKSSASYSSQRRLIIGDGSGMSSYFDIDQSWNRYSRTGKGGASDEVYASHNTSGGYLFGLQLEFSSTFPSSYISTSIGAATRGSDILFYESIPPRLRTDSFEFYIEPMFSSGESLSSSYMGKAFTLMSFGANDHIKISGERIYLVASSGGPTSQTISSSVLLWSRYQRMTIQVSPKEGRLSIFSASQGSGNYFGSQFSFGGAHLFVGSMSGTNGDSYFGRISSLYG